MAMFTLGMDPNAVRQVAADLQGSARDLQSVSRTINTCVASLERSWGGADVQRFAQETRRTAIPAIAACERSITEMARVLGRNAEAQDRSSAVDGPAAGSGAMTPQKAIPDPTATPGPSPQPPGPDSESGDRRDPDGRDGRRVEDDRRTGDRGREPDRRENSHLNNDWAGRAMLERYLTGGGDWNIENDPTWTDYMQSSPTLQQNLQPSIDEQSRNALEQYKQTGNPNGSYDMGSRQMEMENGEGIQGHQYLHGTNADAGGFKQSGTTKVEQLPNGNYRVTMDNNYQWNDTIDPNPKYSTDRWKSKLAEIITLGRADGYDMHISWQSQTVVEYDANGNVVSRSGYPY